MITVSEDEMLTAVRLLARYAPLVAEPGEAIAAAACLFRPRRIMNC
jgi:threonine dehydratase